MIRSRCVFSARWSNTGKVFLPERSKLHHRSYFYGSQVVEAHWDRVDSELLQAAIPHNLTWCQTYEHPLSTPWWEVQESDIGCDIPNDCGELRLTFHNTILRPWTKIHDSGLILSHLWAVCARIPGSETCSRRHASDCRSCDSGSLAVTVAWCEGAKSMQGIYSWRAVLHVVLAVRLSNSCTIFELPLCSLYSSNDQCSRGSKMVRYRQRWRSWYSAVNAASLTKPNCSEPLRSQTWICLCDIKSGSYRSLRTCVKSFEWRTLIANPRWSRPYLEDWHVGQRCVVSTDVRGLTLCWCSCVLRPWFPRIRSCRILVR